MEKKIKHPRLDASLSGKRGIRTLGNQKWLQRISSPSPSTTRTSFQYYETKRIRTSDPQFRKLMLYPAELWSHFGKGGIRVSFRKGGDSNPRTRYQVNSLAGSPIRPLSHLSKIHGERGIRTPGEFPHSSFQDCHHRPLGHLSSKSALSI